MKADVPDDTPLADNGQPIVYDTNEVDELVHALTGDEGEDDSVTVLRRLVRYVENVWPGKTALQVLIELEERNAGVAVPVRFFRWEVAQAYTGTIYRVKDERGDWVADFAEKDQAERFCHTPGVALPDGGQQK